MAPRYEPTYLDPHFSDRFAQLPKDAMRNALKLIGRLANTDPLLGKPCGYQHSTGNLFDCRKLYFDVDENRDPRWRLIYRVLPSEEHPEVIELVTVGLKYVQDAAGNRQTIYVRAGELLDRI